MSREETQYRSAQGYAARISRILREKGFEMSRRIRSPGSVHNGILYHYTGGYRATVTGDYAFIMIRWSPEFRTLPFEDAEVQIHLKRAADHLETKGYGLDKRFRWAVPTARSLVRVTDSVRRKPPAMVPAPGDPGKLFLPEPDV